VARAPGVAGRNFLRERASLTLKGLRAPGGSNIVNRVTSLTMNSNGKSWLDLYVDAMMEKDPYKRLAMVRKLRNVRRQSESDEVAFDEIPLRRSAKATAVASRGRRR
jgi:hypothetical protein